MTDDEEESEKEEDSNQEAQAALASVARDCGFGAHELTDILHRLPDATLIENILGQELSKNFFIFFLFFFVSTFFLFG